MPTWARGASSTASNAGADVVVTGRVTDASVIVGPGRRALRLGAAPTTTRWPGAVAAGHVIECGAQATGGNYAFFTEIADLTHARVPARRDRTPTARR